MPYKNEHAARLTDPEKYKRFRRQNNKFGEGIDAIFGIRKDNNKVELQAIRFKADKFTVAQAKKWLKDHGYKPIRFEAATGKKQMISDKDTSTLVKEWLEEHKINASDVDKKDALSRLNAHLKAFGREIEGKQLKQIIEDLYMVGYYGRNVALMESASELLAELDNCGCFDRFNTKNIEEEKSFKYH